MSNSNTKSNHTQNLPTLGDVALRAGVNKVTASIVLSKGTGNTRVSEATRQRILVAAQELQYQTSALARSLRQRRTNIIGFYTGGFIDARNPFLTEILSGIQSGCELNERDFLVHGAFRGDSLDDTYSRMLNGMIDGLILHVQTDDALIKRLAASRLPIVAIANSVPNVPSVTVDDVAGSRMLAEHLVSRGHRRVFYGTCPFRLTSAVRRYEGFLTAAKSLGLGVVPLPGNASDWEESELEAAFVSMPKRDRPTAAACWKDAFASLMIDRLTGKGVKIPEDLAVVGFDGFTTMLRPAVSLTTIRAPWREAAQTAVNLIAQSQSKPPAEEIVLPVEFVQGQTT